MNNSAVFNFISLHIRFYASLEPIKEKVNFLTDSEKKHDFFFMMLIFFAHLSEVDG